jgi:hypothetical protein
MIGGRYPTAALAVIVAALSVGQAHGFFHLWRFTEFFSNHDGSVQFIELASLGPGENFAQGATIRSTSTGKVFTFPSDLSGSTSSKRLLIATSGFASLTGAVAPDFTLPSTNFFNPAGDTLTLFAGFDIDVESFTALPTDGVTSRQYNPQNQSQASLGTNMPTNYGGASGSVNLALVPMTTGDYNRNNIVDAADYIIWRDTFEQFAAQVGSGADGNANGMVDADDYTFWRARFGNTVPGTGEVVSVPEPASVALSFMALGAAAVLRVSRPIGYRSKFS